RARDQLLRLVGVSPKAAASRRGDEAMLRRLLLDAYPDRVCVRRERERDTPDEPARALMVGGRGVLLDRRSSVHEARCFVAIDVDDGAALGGDPSAANREALVRIASAVDEAWLETRWVERLELDERSGRVRAAAERCYLDLVLERREATPDAEAAAALLARALRARGLAEGFDLGRSQVAARLDSLRQWMPELALPDPLVLLDGALESLLAGCTRLDAAREVDLDGFLLAQLDHGQRAALEREAPAALAVPSGSKRRLSYRGGEAPVLAVRIQEMFGARDTPRVASGRVPVLLHLLAPNQRPAQVTGDLASFWQNGYPEVRKELRRRYPKHAWPDDPIAAKPERRPQRKR
ncbi:MAG: ATP-dependent helicase HrpB, partial [Myxococcales bacterium]|nr:ATP-dependent helicase HrpB [Myxococcales bacterium]